MYHDAWLLVTVQNKSQKLDYYHYYLKYTVHIYPGTKVINCFP